MMTVGAVSQADCSLSAALRQYRRGRQSWIVACTTCCNQRVCMSVCLSVPLSVICSSVCSHISKTHVQTSRYFLYMLPVAVVRSFSDDDATRYVLPVLWMTSRFHIMGPMQLNQTPSYVSLSLVEFSRWRHRGQSCCLRLQTCLESFAFGCERKQIID